MATRLLPLVCVRYLEEHGENYFVAATKRFVNIA